MMKQKEKKHVLGKDADIMLLQSRHFLRYDKIKDVSNNTK